MLRPTLHSHMHQTRQQQNDEVRNAVARDYVPGRMQAKGYSVNPHQQPKPPSAHYEGFFVKLNSENGIIYGIILLILLFVLNESTDLTTSLMLPQSSSAIKRVDQVSSIRQVVLKNPNADAAATPNFYEMLERKNCLPSPACLTCLDNSKRGSNCSRCHAKCSCFCEALCKETVPPKRVVNHWIVKPPAYKADRLIPRIVHQTWFEPITAEKYPNWSRLSESFKHESGWEYRFYSDIEAADFISAHFPTQVREAYDALLPGAFKADLFRYCVLLIHGGVYSDIDVMLQSSLEYAIPPDVGFMVPIDEPGLPANRRFCVWNGFMAAAPGHPYLMQAIETVVNQVRNRFTSLDSDATFCPDPEFSVLHNYDTLFVAGPCLLGASVNRVLKSPPQTSFEVGELHTASHDENGFIPGRTIILSQNKRDMGK
jgi:hypothetical protein